MAVQFAECIPLPLLTEVHCEFQIDKPKPDYLCVLPMKQLEIFWINHNINKLFAATIPTPTIQQKWLIKQGIDIPDDLINPILEEAHMNELHSKNNIIAAFWVAGEPVLCFPTGQLMEYISVITLRSSLQARLIDALKGGHQLPGNSMYVGHPVHQIKANAVGESKESTLLAVVSAATVFIYTLLAPDRENKMVRLKLSRKLEFQSHVSSIVFCDYLVVVTADGSSYFWDPLAHESLRVLKKGTANNRGTWLCTHGSTYNSVFVSDSTMVFRYDFREKITYQKPVLKMGEGTIALMDCSPSDPFDLLLHTNKFLHLYDIRYVKSPFISWVSSSEFAHSLSRLPPRGSSKFIISASTDGQVFLYQYKSGMPPDLPKRTRWEAYQPLSAIAAQFPPFSYKSPHIFNSVPYPSQTPYYFTKIDTIMKHSNTDLQPRFCGTAPLSFWPGNDQNNEFSLYQISHFGDVYWQHFRLHDFDSRQPPEEKISLLGQIGLHVYNNRAVRLEAETDAENTLNTMQGITDWLLQDTDHEGHIHDVQEVSSRIIKRQSVRINLDINTTNVPSKRTPQVALDTVTTFPEELTPYLTVDITSPKLFADITKDTMEYQMPSTSAIDRALLQNAFVDSFLDFSEDFSRRRPSTSRSNASQSAQKSSSQSTPRVRTAPTVRASQASNSSQPSQSSQPLPSSQSSQTPKNQKTPRTPKLSSSQSSQSSQPLQSSQPSRSSSPPPSQPSQSQTLLPWESSASQPSSQPSSQPLYSAPPSPPLSPASSQPSQFFQSSQTSLPWEDPPASQSSQISTSSQSRRVVQASGTPTSSAPKRKRKMGF